MAIRGVRGGVRLVVFTFTIDVILALLGGLLGAVLLTAWDAFRLRGRPAA